MPRPKSKVDVGRDTPLCKLQKSQRSEIEADSDLSAALPCLSAPLPQDLDKLFHVDF